MARNGTSLALWSGSLLLAVGFLAAAAAFAASRAADFSTRITPPAGLDGLDVTPVNADGAAFTTRLGGVTSSFSIDHVSSGSGSDFMPRMRWSRPLGSTVAGARFSRYGWSLDLTGGYGGDETGGAVQQPGAARNRSGFAGGLEYDFGPWQLGGYYQFSHSDMGFTPAGEVESGYGLGANYTVVPGLSLFS